MSDNSTDYNKRTCIICGCHTSQTINIYEPRTGPNIVQLIQARFKFQPLNDDKYLCYSCNNWLINWHSLQALNSNNADNSSGTFRTSNLNNTKPEMSSTLDVSSKISQCSKPIAIVRPRIREQSNQLPKDESNSINEKRNKCIYSKLGPFSLERERISQRKFLSRRKALRKSLAVTSTSTAVGNCKNCCKIIASSDINLDTLSQKELHSERQSVSNNNGCSLVNRTPNRKLAEKSPPVALPYLSRQNQRSLIDGKVVSMLRRIGTTLSRDLQSASDTYQPSIAIPTKNTQTRRPEIADDEIQINFNSAISEVLSYNERESSYNITNATSDTVVIGSSDDEQDISKDPPNFCEKNVNSKINLQQVFSLVPKGLSVSLISGSDITC